MKRFVVIETEERILGVRKRALITSAITAENFAEAHIKFMKSYPQYGAKITYIIEADSMHKIVKIK